MEVTVEVSSKVRVEVRAGGASQVQARGSQRRKRIRNTIIRMQISSVGLR